MANRFERLFQLPQNQYIEGSPVILAAGVLSKDSDTGSIIAQLKFQSVSEKRIKAVKVSLAAYDVSNAEIQGVNDYQYLDLDVSNGQEFGANKAVVMPSPVSRSFEVSAITVVFVDGTMWETTAPFSVLSAVKALSFENAELEKQYRIATNGSAQYVPTKEKGLWQCTCGVWNCGSSCTHCHISQSKVFAAFNIDLLTDQMNVRLAAEAEKRRIDEEKEAEKKAQQEVAKKAAAKKIKLVTAIVVPIVVIILLFTQWILPTFIQPAIAYNNAEKMLSAGQYEDAIDAFRGLGDYKDSSARIAEAQEAIYARDYEAAEKLFANKEYEKALEAFAALGYYKDATEKSALAKNAMLDEQYAIAEELLNSGKYEEAIVAFEQIKSHKDSASRITEAENLIKQQSYDYAESLYNEGDFAAAAIEFGKLKDYSDAKERCSAIWRNIVPDATIASSNAISAAVVRDGTVVATPYVGDSPKSYGAMDDTSNWSNINSIAIGTFHTLGLKSDGTVVATGGNTYGTLNVGNWENVVQIAAGTKFSMALFADGTVKFATDEYSFKYTTWEKIRMIYANGPKAIGIRIDGTVIIESEHGNGCDCCAVSSWRDIVAIASSDWMTVGVKSDGTVITTNGTLSNVVSTWRNIVAVGVCGTDTIVGLKDDGTLVIASSDPEKNVVLFKAEKWNNIVAIATGYWHIIGLKEDGTVVTTPIVEDSKLYPHDDGQCNVSGWTNIKAQK